MQHNYCHGCQRLSIIVACSALVIVIIIVAHTLGLHQLLELAQGIAPSRGFRGVVLADDP